MQKKPSAWTTKHQIQGQVNQQIGSQELQKTFVHDRGICQRLLLCASALSSLRIFINVSNVTIFAMARIQITSPCSKQERYRR